MLASFLFGEFLLHIPCWLNYFLSREFLLHIPCWFHFYSGSFSYTSQAGFIFIWGVSLTHPVLAPFFFFFFFFLLSREFLLHIPCWFYSIFWEFLFHIPSWIHFYARSFSYTSRARLIFIWGVSLTHPMLHSFFFLQGSLSYTSRAGFNFMRGVSLTNPVLPLFLAGEFLLHILSWFHSFLSGEFPLHIPCCLHFYSGSFSYTSRADLIIFISGVSLTHPMLVSFLSGEFLLHTPCWHHFYFIFYFIIIISRVSLTHPVLVLFNFLGVSLSHPELASFLCREFLLHIPC